MLNIYFFFFLILFIYLWLCWVFVSVRGLSLVAASGDYSSLRCAGLSLSWPLPLRSTGFRRAGSAIVAHGPSCSAACGIFPGQGSNPCPLHWQADSQPLRHQGSPIYFFNVNYFIYLLWGRLYFPKMAIIFFGLTYPSRTLLLSLLWKLFLFHLNLWGLCDCLNEKNAAEVTSMTSIRVTQGNTSSYWLTTSLKTFTLAIQPPCCNEAQDTWKDYM